MARWHAHQISSGGARLDTETHAEHIKIRQVIAVTQEIEKLSDWASRYWASFLRTSSTVLTKTQRGFIGKAPALPEVGCLRCPMFPVLQNQFWTNHLPVLYWAFGLQFILVVIQLPLWTGGQDVLLLLSVFDVCTFFFNKQVIRFRLSTFFFSRRLSLVGLSQ